ncbi:MAG: type II secretion system F family protein [Phycisphaerales bacterium JB039]
MSLWRYRALAPGGDIRSGELSAASAPDARASLRRLGLRVLDLREVRSHDASALVASVLGPAAELIRSYVRCRRASAKAELCDALATMLDSGLPLTEALATLADSAPRSWGPWRRSDQRAVLGDLGERVTAGEALSDAMAQRPTWFDASEIAIAEAGQRRGELASALRAIGERHARAGEIASRLAGALAYPTLVAAVGLGVVVFLANKPLPRLASILTDASVEIPALTRVVMALGQTLAIWWPVGLGLVLAAIGGVIASTHAAARRGSDWPDALRRLVPGALRAGAIARMAAELSAMGRCGVPMVEGLQAAASAFHGPVTASLGRRLREAAGAVERGDDLASALNDPRWFTPELLRLIAIGETSGELEPMLDRLAQRESRRARRMADRLAAAVEPAVILMLAAVIGVVVLAAALPLVRLQEVI